jgi:methionine-rich copper-binding protein CopC/flagellar hook assembly protein FlgD
MKYLRGKKMSKLITTSIAFVLVFCLTASIAGAVNLNNLTVTNSVGQETIGTGQSLSITFTADDFTADGHYAVIVDANKNGNYDDDSVIKEGKAVNDQSVSITLVANDLTSRNIKDGNYRLAVVIFDGDKIDWTLDTDDGTENITLDTSVPTVTEFTADPNPFSPNGDGVKDTTTIYYTLSESLSGNDSVITMTIGEGTLNVPAKPTPGTLSGRNTVIWDGKDGLGRYVDQGDYLVKIHAVDAGGNVNQNNFSFTVKVRTKQPEISSTTPALDGFVSTLLEVKAQLKDNSGEGLDLTNSLIKLLDPSSVTVPGSQSDDGTNTLRWKLSTTLAGDGSKDGKYTIAVTAVDKVGNSKTATYTFFFDTVFPKIASITPADGAILTSAPANIVIVLNDGNGSGTDLANTAKSLKIDNGATTGSATHNGVNTITFVPFTSFAKGIHTIEITPVDIAGNKSQAITFQFGYFDNTSDIIQVTTDPIDKAIKNATSEFKIISATMTDSSGKGIDLDTSTIRLEGPGGSQIAGTQNKDTTKNMITWEFTPLPADGSADGTYTIRVKAVSKSGITKDYSSSFVYDTKAPTLTSITPADGSVLTTAPTQVIIKVSDGTGSGINFVDSRSSMKLSNVTNIIRSDNGVDTMIFSFLAPDTTGEYTIEIALKDKAGNVNSLTSKFRYVSKPEDILPSVTSTVPVENAFIQGIKEVSTVLKDNSGKGIDFDASTIRLNGPNNAQIAGSQSYTGQTITWKLSGQLPTNGSADGTYTIVVKAVDKAGGVTNFTSTFLYDTKAPEFTSLTPADGSVVPTNFSEIIAKVTDGSGSGVDFSQVVIDLQADSKAVSNIIKSDNGIDTIIYSFPVTEDVKKYNVKITLKDRAGNIYTKLIVYIGKATDVFPEIQNTTPADRSFINALANNKVSVTLKDNSGKGIDFDSSTIRLENSKGVVVDGYQTIDKNTNLIAWNLTSQLPTDGSADGTYTVKVKAVDYDGIIKEQVSTFLYDSQVPALTSIIPADGSVFTTAPTQIVVKATDVNGSGIDFASSRASMKLMIGTKEIANIVKTDNGVDTMTFSLPALSDKGKYTASITLKDKAGNVYSYSIQFDYVEKSVDLLPEVTSTTPVDKVMVKELKKASAVLKDNSGKGIDLEKSTISIENPAGVALAGRQTDDSNLTISFELTNPLPTNGSVDGTYTIKVKAVDKAGGTTQYTSTFLYDTNVPMITSITPAKGSLVTTALTEIVIKVSDGSGSGIDFSKAAISKFLIGNKEITNIIKSDNGVDTIKFAFPALEDTGKYTMNITLTDMAGNVYIYPGAFEYVSKADDVKPEIVSTVPADKSYVNGVTVVTATLKDNSSKGIDFDASTISLEDSKGTAIAGRQIYDKNNNTITLNLNSPLPTNGSVDGTYTIKVKAVDKVGGIKEQAYTFVYDTLIPTLTSVTPVDGTIMTKPITEIIMKVSDGNGGGIDFASSRASMKLKTSLKEISNISRQDNGVDTLTFNFAPIEDYSRYTIEITLKDRAGNSFTYQSKFDYVRKTTESLPDVTSTDPTDKSYKNSIAKVTAVLKDNSEKGIDFDLSTIVLQDPKGVIVDGRQTDNTTNTINWELANSLPTDGSVDGTYVIKVKAIDNDGAEYNYSSTFLYDSLAPTVVNTTPAAGAALSQDVTQVTVQLSDGTGSGIDLKGTDVKLQGPKAVVQTNRSDGADNTVTLAFSKLTDTGKYTIQIVPKDRAGNTGYSMAIQFSYVLKAPAVKSVLLTNREYIHELSNIEAVLEDRSGIGLDLTETGSTIVVKDSTGKALQGDQVSKGTDTIIWNPVSPLANDGTDDGTYTVTVTPMDTLGVTGQSRQYSLIFDSQTPQVISAVPVDINANLTYISQQVILVQAKLQDKGPSGLEIKDQKIYLEDSAKKQVAGVQTDNNSDTIVWNLNAPLARDGSNDDTYNVVVIAKDKAGNEKEFRYPMVYDTVPPTVASVTPADNTILNTSLASVTVTLKDNVKIDFQASKVELQNPSGANISGVLSNNGVDKMTLTFPVLEDSGTYTIVTTAVDKAGNGAGNVYKTRFVFKTGLPVVVSTTPVTMPAEKAYINSSISEVKAVIQETDSGGIDFSPTGSEIKLKGPDGKVLIGSQSNDGQNTLKYSIGKPLTSDGFDDGQYTILVTTANSAKRKDVEKSFTFTYDTQSPEIISATQPLNVDSDVSYVSTSITSLSVKLRDKGPAGVNLDKSVLRLLDPNSNTISGTNSNDDVDTLKLEFSAGLLQEGKYTLSVSAVDKAGNFTNKDIKFVYGVSVPKVVSTTPVTVPATKAYVRTQIKEVQAVLSETGTSGIDFSSTGSTVRLSGPKGDVPGIQTNDGKTTLIFTLTKPLAVDGSDDGSYTISVTPVNSAKLKGQKLDYTFTYDTVSPKVSVDDISLLSFGGTDSSLGGISAIIKDELPSSGFDWDAVDNTWMSLRDSGGKEILGEVAVVQAQSEIRFILDSPLASNGKDDGFYTVIITPKDKAGNTPVPVIQYEFLYDTKPPTVNKTEITINDKPLLLDSSLEEYPTAINTKNSVTITAKMTDERVGVDLTSSTITITDPKGNVVSGSLMQDGKETIWFTTVALNEEGLYKVQINPVDLDQNGKTKSSETVSTEFLFEMGKPKATITEPGVGSANTESEDKPIIIKGTATDVASTTGASTSGIAKVELGGTGPGGKELEWLEVLDDEKARDASQPMFSKWYINFIPDESGTYKIKLRVWDKAGNSEIYDTKLELKFTISLSFQGRTYCWPNPVTNGVAHISFQVNTPSSQNVDVTLYVYDVSGDLVYEKTYPGVQTKARMNFEWECRNSSGEKVVTGMYVFRFKAELPNGDQVAYKVGKPMIIKN